MDGWIIAIFNLNFSEFGAGDFPLEEAKISLGGPKTSLCRKKPASSIGSARFKPKKRPDTS